VTPNSLRRIFRHCASACAGLVYTEIESPRRHDRPALRPYTAGAASPIHFFALIEIISKLKDSKGKVLIPGFYKGVKAPSKDELKAWKRPALQRRALP